MFRFLLVFLLAFLFPLPALAQQACEGGAKCVPPEDLEVFVKLLKEKKCLQDEKPVYTIDPIVITTDVEGRVYYSGAMPKPYTIRMKWCNYETTAQGVLNVQVAKKVPPDWGFRFRLKFYGGFLFTDAFEKYAPDDKYDPSRAVDAGLQADFLYWRFINLNVGAGFRSVNASVGFDLTKNFGAFAGYAFSFWTLKHNPQAGLYFAFW